MMYTWSMPRSTTCQWKMAWNSEPVVGLDAQHVERPHRIDTRRWSSCARSVLSPEVERIAFLKAIPALALGARAGSFASRASAFLYHRGSAWHLLRDGAGAGFSGPRSRRSSSPWSAPLRRTPRMTADVDRFTRRTLRGLHTLPSAQRAAVVERILRDDSELAPVLPQLRADRVEALSAEARTASARQRHLNRPGRERSPAVGTLFSRSTQRTRALREDAARKETGGRRSLVASGCSCNWR